MTQSVDDILASALSKSPITITDDNQAHENTPLVSDRSNEGENNSNSASAHPEATPIKSVDEVVTFKTELTKLESTNEVKGFDKNAFLAKVQNCLKTKMDSMDLKNAMADITSFLG